MATEALELLVRANLAAAAAALLIFVLRLPVRRLAGARTAYALWGILPLAALAALIPAPAPIPIVVPLPAEIAAAPWTVDPMAPPAPGLDLTALFVVLWTAGAVLGAIFTAWRHLRLMRGLGRLSPRADGALEAQACDVGPAVLGAIRPRIIVPADFDTRYDPAERALILTHERAHLAGGDAQANAAIVFLQCLFWANPLVHLAAHYARLDQELACDAAVLARRPGSRRAYAAALLKSQLGQPPVALGCAWPARSVHPLKHRLLMMQFAPPGTLRRLLGGLAVALASFSCAYAAWAAKPAEMVANVVAEIASLDLGQPRRISGRVVRVKYSGPISEVTLVDGGGELWKATSRGRNGLAMADWARITPDIVIEGYLPRLSVCAADPCLVHLGPAPTAAVPAPAATPFQPALIEARSPAPAPAPDRLLPGLPDHAVDLAPDPAAPVRVRGAITRVDWRFPNAVIHMISFPDGQRWQVAGGAPSNLARAGLNPEDLAAGSQVMVRGYRPAEKDCTPDCKVVGASVTFEDGQGLSLWGLE